MRNLVFAAAAMLAIAAPGMAAAQTGFVDLSYNSSDVEVGGTSNDSDGWALGGAVAFDAHALGVQLDAQVGSSEADAGDDADFWNIGGHVYSRNSSYLFGGFASYGNIDAGAGGDLDFWTVGAEGQLYLDRTTLNGAVSYGEADDVDASVTAVDLGVRHFLTDNFAIDGNVGFGNVDAGGGADDDVIVFGVGTEFQFDQMPVSLFASYQRSDADDADLEADSFSVGVRYNWGGTLFDRDRSGAGLGRGAGSGRFLGLI